MVKQSRSVNVVKQSRSVNVVKQSRRSVNVVKHDSNVTAEWQRAELSR